MWCFFVSHSCSRERISSYGALKMQIIEYMNFLTAFVRLLNRKYARRDNIAKYNISELISRSDREIKLLDEFET